MNAKYFLLTSLSLLTLSACTTTPVNEIAYTPLPQISYEHLTKIPVRVKNIEFDSFTQRGAGAWDIAGSLPTPPDVAMSRYMSQRYKPVGADGLLNMRLTKANIYKDDSPNENKILSYIPWADVEEYTFEIIVELESLYNSGLPDRKTSTRFVRKVRLPINATMAFREARFQKTLEEIIKDMDEAITSILVDQLKLVRSKDRPVHTIDVKTELPEIETKLGVKVNEMRLAGERLGESFKPVSTHPHPSQNLYEDSPEPVKITPSKTEE